LLGLQTHVCSNSGLGPATALADHVARIDITDASGVLEYVRQHQINLVYSIGSDLAMPTACQVSQELDLPTLVSLQTALTCNSKPSLRAALGQNFPGNLRYQVLEQPDPDRVSLPYPLVLKPADSQGGRGVNRLDSPEELSRAFEQAIAFSRQGRVILEEWIPGPEFSLNLYLLAGQIVFSAVSDRRVWPQFAIGLVRNHLYPAGLSSAAQHRLLELARSACQRLDIRNGPAYFQVKYWQDRLFLIEITPRLDGCHLWRLIRSASGVDLLRITFEHLLGRPPCPADFQPQALGSFQLEFTCQPPGQPALNLPVPSCALFSDYYYAPGEPVRRINGLLEKTGYFITAAEDV
jgi:hypothetical protein